MEGNTLILLCIGLFSGSISGFFGIGGGIVIVPSLVAFCGMSQKSAQGTTLAMQLLPLGIAGVFNYYKEGFVDIKSALIVFSTFLIGSYFGSKFISNVNDNDMRKLFGFFIIIIGTYLIIKK